MRQNMPSHRRLVSGLVMLVCGMLMLSYAAVPLYNLFCKVTGFGGTPTQAEQAPEEISDRALNVRLNADVDPELPWEFEPVQTQVTLNIGEEKLIFYRAKNLSEEAVTGMAVYNVTPNAAGEYFSKIECFCFEEQRLEPGSEVNMPISFFIDPAILDDPYLQDLQTVTLSYTFFKSKNSP